MIWFCLLNFKAQLQLLLAIVGDEILYSEKERDVETTLRERIHADRLHVPWHNGRRKKMPACSFIKFIDPFENLKSAFCCLWEFTLWYHIFAVTLYPVGQGCTPSTVAGKFQIPSCLSSISDWRRCIQEKQDLNLVGLLCTWKAWKQWTCIWKILLVESNVVLVLSILRWVTLDGQRGLHLKVKIRN